MRSSQRRLPRYSMLATTVILLSFILSAVSGQDVSSQSMSQLRGQQRSQDQNQNLLEHQQQKLQGKRKLQHGQARANRDDYHYYDDDDDYAYAYPTTTATARASKGKSKGSSGGSDDDVVDAEGRQGNHPIRCIIRGRPLGRVSVARRRPMIRDHTQPGFARIQRRGFDGDNDDGIVSGGGGFDGGGDDGENNRERQLQRTQGGGGRVYWPSVEKEEDCFFGVFSINAAAVTRPPERTPSPTNPSPTPAPSLLGPTVVPVVGKTMAMTPTISSAPSVSSSPTSPPSLSSSPSVSSNPTGITRNLQFDTVSRTVQTTLNFGFFFGTTVRTPTDAELTGILRQIDTFYTDHFRKSSYSPTFSELQINLVSSSFDPTQVPASENEADKYPISLVMNFVMLFLDSSAVTSVQVPTGDQIIALMENADYLDFIESYAWVATPTNGLFFETQVVQYGVVNLNSNS